MDKQKIISTLDDFNISSFEPLKSQIKSLESIKDILYQANVSIFQSSSINHKDRLKLLKKTDSLAKKNKEYFCIAHNLTLRIKVCKELGLHKSLIKDSHKSIDLWKKVLQENLAINGLIFSYTDLGILYSDNKLHSLALKYLNKAESLLSECENDYPPYIKLYVAFAIVSSRINNNKKSNFYYEKVIKRAGKRNDTRTLIPILVNNSNDNLLNKEFKKCKSKSNQALKISKEKNDQIYRPYIYHILGKLHLELKNFKEAELFLTEAYAGFEKINSNKMLPELMHSLGLNFYNNKEYENAEKTFIKALNINKKLKQYSVDVSIYKSLCKMYEENSEDKKKLKYALELNNVLEKHLEENEKMYSENNSNAIKHLSEEFNLSLRKQKDLEIKFNLESKKRELTSKALMSVSESEFLKKIIKKLNNQQIDNKKLISICKDRVRNIHDWNVFLKLFNDINPYFNKYIIEKCPLITESELRVCNLIKMSFGSNEIAEILSITIRGVEQHRYRIRKKLKLNTDLTIYLQSL